MEDNIRKLFRRHRGKGGGKFEEDDFVNAGRLEACELLFRTREKSQLDVRGKHPDRMWIEGQDHGRACDRARPLDNRLQQ